MSPVYLSRVEQKLHRLARSDNWLEVLKMYKEDRELRRAKLTQTGETILHMAVSSEKVKEVQEMVDFVCGKRSLSTVVDENGDDKKLVLGAENDGKNTLHLAASLGNVEICKKIGGADPSLIAGRNIAGETPFFLAAFHGKKEAFLWLHDLYMNSRPFSSTNYAHCVRDNDDTILHCAIAGGHIDVAIEIVRHYKYLKDEMMIKRNKDGLSPLHLLAATPSGFKSTDLLNRSFIVQLIYHWFFTVQKKERATMTKELKQREGQPSIRALKMALPYYPDNYRRSFNSFLKFIWFLIVLLQYVLLFLLIPLSVLERLYLFEVDWFYGIRKMKEKHTWSLQITEQILHQNASKEDLSEITLRTPSEPTSTSSNTKKNNEPGSIIVETPLMIAAKNGVVEMVDMILGMEKFRSTIGVVNDEGKNAVLLAVEKRQIKLYQFLYENKNLTDESAFRQMDKDGNTALHLAARLGVNLNWRTTTMIEEFKWFEFVKKSVPSNLWERYNDDGKTTEEIFIDSYGEQMTSDREWLNQTSEACSVVSTLVASMVFPNVADNFVDKDYPSLVALSLSLTSTISFLAIHAFRSQSINFWKYVPFMLHVAILTMFDSIVALWISLMFHGHSLKTYGILGSPIAIFIISSLPIFVGPTLTSMFTKVPPPNRRTTSAIRYRRNKKKQNATYLKPPGIGADGNKK